MFSILRSLKSLRQEMAITLVFCVIQTSNNFVASYASPYFDKIPQVTLIQIVPLWKVTSKDYVRTNRN